MSTPDTFAGFHQFPAIMESEKPYGSFEVFENSGLDVPGSSREPGWYWWACFPGCLPESDPDGPYPTSEGAYLAAIGD